MTRFSGYLAVILLVFTASCDEPPEAETEQPIRAIKYITLDQRAGEQERRIAGIVAASITTNVAFEINGQLVALLRKPGEKIAEGELLARLDAEPYRLQVDQSQAALDQALAAEDDARKKFEQQRKLRQQGFATQTSLDSAEATLKNAEGAVRAATSQLDLARRDLAKTDLKAPFDGVIARQSVEVFEEVQTGQAIYSVQTAQGDKIEASLPETLINSVSLGDEVEVRFPPLGGAVVTGKLDEVAPLAGDANAYPVKITLDQTPPGLRPGMSAELVFRFASETTGQAYLVPLTAVQPSADGTGDSAVFVYDPASGKLTRTAVRVVNVKDNNLEILGDLADGAIVASAGVSFLHDGMVVELFDPATLN